MILNFRLGIGVAFNTCFKVIILNGLNNSPCLVSFAYPGKRKRLLRDKVAADSLKERIKNLGLKFLG